jgi:hypothetical protein
MPLPQPNHEFLLFQRMARHKQTRAPETPAVGEALVAFFKQNIEKKHAKVGKVTDTWIKLVPPTLCEHCVLEGMHRGTLTVLVDSSSHLYELKQLLLAGLEQQLVLACKAAGLRKVTLKAGRAPEVPDERRTGREGREGSGTR